MNGHQLRRPTSTPAAIVGFTDHLHGEGLSATTIRNYVPLLRGWLTWCGAHQVDPVTASKFEVRCWSDDDGPATYASRKQRRQALRAWFGYVGRTDAPHEGVRVPAKPRLRSKALDEADARRLAATATMMGGREGTATLCGLYLAARRCEISALRWDGWDDGWFTFDRSKNDDRHRVPVHPVLAEALEAHRKGATSLYVFPGDRGRAHVTPATIWEWVRHVGQVAGMKLTPHLLRHTALTYALEATKDLRAVQELAGHRDPLTTTIYTRVSQRRLEETVDALTYLDEPPPDTRP